MSDELDTKPRRRKSAQNGEQAENGEMQYEAKPSEATEEGHELPPLPELDERMQDPKHPLSAGATSSLGSSEHLIFAKPTDSDFVPGVMEPLGLYDPHPLAKEIRRVLHLGDTAADRAIEKHVQHGITVVSQVETRVIELCAMKRRGHRCTTAQNDLIDFWNIDHFTRSPQPWQYAEMLKAADIQGNLRWSRWAR